MASITRNIRFDDSLLERLNKAAHRDKRSMNSFIALSIEKYIEDSESKEAEKPKVYQIEVLPTQNIRTGILDSKEAANPAIKKQKTTNSTKKEKSARKSPENDNSKTIDFSKDLVRGSSEIDMKIAAIIKEEIPADRNTNIGKKIWKKEQEEKISELQKQLQK